MQLMMALYKQHMKQKVLQNCDDFVTREEYMNKFQIPFEQCEILPPPKLNPIKELTKKIMKEFYPG